jgi:hypothetical protein
LVDLKWKGVKEEDLVFNEKSSNNKNNFGVLVGGKRINCVT